MLVLGYGEGELSIESRFAEGNNDRLDRLATELGSALPGSNRDRIGRRRSGRKAGHVVDPDRYDIHR